jgi:hypothetical protein
MYTRFIINKENAVIVHNSFIQTVLANPTIFQVSNTVIFNVYQSYLENISDDGLAFQHIFSILAKHGKWVMLENFEEQGIWQITCQDLESHKPMLIEFFAAYYRCNEEELICINDFEEDQKEGLQTVNMFLKL